MPHWTARKRLSWTVPCFCRDGGRAVTCGGCDEALHKSLKSEVFGCLRKYGLVLTGSSHKNVDACLGESTLEALAMRGWAVNIAPLQRDLW